MNWFLMERWSPYIVGAGIGILSWITFLLSDKPLGCSTAFARTGGMIQKLFRRKKVEENLYYQQFKPEIDWEWILVIGLFFGALASSLLSGMFRISWLPSLWVASFGETSLLRWAVAFAGGILMGFGARWAGGCTSGHGISGTMQLAVTSWISAVMFFVGGIAGAFLIFKVLGGM